jgi:hypothetical protein
MDEIAIIMKSLLSLIKPLCWVNPLIPMIPATLADITGSPFGALIGIHSKIWEEYCEQEDELRSDDAYVLFLNDDSNICVNKLVEIPDSGSFEDFIYQYRDLFKYPDEDCKAKRQ